MIYSQNLAGEAEENMKNLSQDSQPLDYDSDLLRPKCKAEVLITTPQIMKKRLHVLHLVICLT
jgi:hypothetical protein